MDAGKKTKTRKSETGSLVIGICLAIFILYVVLRGHKDTGLLIVIFLVCTWLIVLLDSRIPQNYWGYYSEIVKKNAALRALFRGKVGGGSP